MARLKSCPSRCLWIQPSQGAVGGLNNRWELDNRWVSHVCVLGKRGIPQLSGQQVFVFEWRSAFERCDLRVTTIPALAAEGMMSIHSPCRRRIRPWSPRMMTGRGRSPRGRGVRSWEIGRGNWLARLKSCPSRCLKSGQDTGFGRQITNNGGGQECSPYT